MDKKRLELIATAILIVIFILVVSNNFKRTKAKAGYGAAEPSAAAVSAPVATYATGASLERANMPEEEGEAVWGRDPFVLNEVAPVAVDTVSNLKLNGITTVKGGAPKAFINNDIVSIGSRIGKFTVLKITHNKVIVTDGGKNFELEMK